MCIDSVGKVVSCKTGKGSDLYVDGGLTGNFPIHMFDSIASDGRRICNRGTVGFRLDTPEPIVSDRAGNGLATYKIVSIKNYAASFYSYVIEHLNRSGIDADDWARTVSISSGKVGPKMRKLSAAEKDILSTAVRRRYRNTWIKNSLVVVYHSHTVNYFLHIFRPPTQNA